MVDHCEIQTRSRCSLISKSISKPASFSGAPQQVFGKNLCSSIFLRDHHDGKLRFRHEEASKRARVAAAALFLPIGEAKFSLSSKSCCRSCENLVFIAYFDEQDSLGHQGGCCGMGSCRGGAGVTGQKKKRKANDVDSGVVVAKRLRCQSQRKNEVLSDCNFVS